MEVSADFQEEVIYFLRHETLSTLNGLVQSAADAVCIFLLHGRKDQKQIIALVSSAHTPLRTKRLQMPFVMY